MLPVVRHEVPLLPPPRRAPRWTSPFSFQPRHVVLAVLFALLVASTPTRARSAAAAAAEKSSSAHSAAYRTNRAADVRAATAEARRTAMEAQRRHAEQIKRADWDSKAAQGGFTRFAQSSATERNGVERRRAGTRSAATAATEERAGNIVVGCATGALNASHDYFPDKVAADVAEDFTVTYHGYYKILNNTFTGEAYVLYQCGTQIPPGYDGLKKFAVPLKTAAVESTTTVTFLEMLGRRTAIQLLTATYLYSSPCIQLMVQNGTINSTSSDSAEAAAQLDAVDIFFTDSYVTANESNYVAVAASYDAGTLRRAEWIDFIATFFNLEATANEIFGTTQSLYLCHAENADTYPTKPVVAWTTFLAAADWNNNISYWQISDTTYKLEFVIDAGGTPLVDPVGVYTNVSLFHEAIKNVDILIDDTYLVNTYNDFLASYQLTATSPFRFIQNQAVYQTDGIQNPSDAQDWFESAVAEPDAVLQSLVAIVHPEYPVPGPVRWFRHVSVNAPVIRLTADQCTGNVSEPRPRAEGSACVPFEDTDLPPTPAPSLSAGGIAGIVIASVVVVTLAAAAAVLLFRRTRFDRERTPLSSSGDSIN